MYYLYKITSPSNKIYIGVTNSPKIRFKDHCKKAYLHKSLVNISVAKYGKENMTFQILNIFNTQEEALKAESKIVTLEFVNRKDTMNLTLGGSMPPVNTASSKPIEIEGIKYSSIKDAAEKLGVNRCVIDRKIKLNLINFKFLFIPDNKPKKDKRSFQYKPIKGVDRRAKPTTFENELFPFKVNIYRKFNITKQAWFKAEKFYGRPPKDLTEFNYAIEHNPNEFVLNGTKYINRAAAMKVGAITNYALHSKFDKGIPLENQRKVAVQMICPETNKILKTFDTMNKAGKYLGKKSLSHISQCCNGKRNIAYGYIWKRVERSNANDIT